MCAIHGQGFYSSALNAKNLVLRNAARYVSLELIAAILFGLSKILVALGTGVIAYAFFSAQVLVPININYIRVHAVVLAFGAYFIAGSFFTVYSMAADTLVMCFCK